MKQAAIISGCLAIATFWGFDNKTPVNVHSALKENKIEASATSTGTHTGEAIRLNIKNNTGKKQEILIPAGTMFIAGNPDEQDILVTSDQIFVMNGTGDNEFLVNGYCCQLSDMSPKSGNNFTIGQTHNLTLKEFCNKVNAGKYSDDVMQEAVWAVSDREPISQIYSENQQEAKALREIVSAVTGRKNDWYEKRMERFLDTDRRIIGNPVSINGEIKYRAKKGEIISAELWGPDNQKLHDLGKGQPSPFEGTLTFNFKLSLEGFPAGAYKVLIKGNDRLIKQEDFEV